MNGPRSDLARDIFSTCHLTGRFELRSGQISSHYFDKYRFEADPALLERIAHALVALLPERPGILAGLELGGIPIATALARVSERQARFVRKARKPYGTKALAEGGEITGEHLIVIEDVVTTGGQILESVADLRALGADISTVVCVIRRNPEANARLAEVGLELKALFDERELFDSAP